MKLRIYTPIYSNRIRYTFKLVLKEFLGVDYDVFTEFDEQIDFVYSNAFLDCKLFLQATPLLTEKGVKERTVLVEQFQEKPILFPTNKPESCLSFDVFSAVFFMVSRYEEYLPFVQDHHKRFSAKQSLAYKNNFLQEPVVHYWVEMLKEQLKDHFPQLLFKKNEYKFTPTYDIDSAFAYKHKGFVRHLGAIGRDVLGFDFKTLKERLSIILGFEKDPMDCFEALQKQHEQYDLKPIFFFLVGNYDRFDKNVSIYNKAFQQIIKNVADYSKVGIHPSYASNEDSEKLEKEINRLSDILHSKITISRQHFLRLSLPETYETLIDFGIKEDYTMGFADEIGFRAGIARDYNFYNILNESETNLRVFPFQIMDTTFTTYLQCDKANAKEQIFTLIEKIKSVDGHFMTLWHNNSIAEIKGWENWGDLHDWLLEETSNKLC